MNEKGISLIELMVVVAIIAILASIATPSYQKWRQKINARNTAYEIASIIKFTRAKTLERGMYGRIKWNLNEYDITACGDNNNDGNCDEIWIKKNYKGVKNCKYDTSNKQCKPAQEPDEIIFRPSGLLQGGGNQTICVISGDYTYKVRISQTTGRTWVEKQ